MRKDATKYTALLDALREASTELYSVDTERERRRIDGDESAIEYNKAWVRQADENIRHGVWVRSREYWLLTFAGNALRGGQSGQEAIDAAKLVVGALWPEGGF